MLGIGFGGTFATALDSAQQAFQVSAQSGEPAIVREAGTVESIFGDDGAAVSLQETSDAMLELAEQTGLGPLTLRRLIAALGRADHKAVTAQQLSEFYGVMPRSARRMLGLLVSAGYAREAGVRAAAAGAGRPHVVYEVDLARLRQVMASGAGVVRAGRRGAALSRSLAGNAPGRLGSCRLRCSDVNSPRPLELRSNNGYSQRGRDGAIRRNPRGICTES